MSSTSIDEIVKSRKQLGKKTKGKSMEEMERMFYNLFERFKAFFDCQGNLDRAIFYEQPNFGQLETNFFELVQQVVNHGKYHRRNITYNSYVATVRASRCYD
ncbi:DinB family protein [Niallia sp. 03133]|uniref:DinB family protein n=1 Tax=Niallia sp. 03133 TaxID=3458060 RepID=UPI004044ABE8